MKRFVIILMLVIALFSFPVTAQSSESGETETAKEQAEETIDTIQVVSRESEVTEEDRNNLIFSLNGVHVKDIRNRKNAEGIEVQIVADTVSTVHLNAISGSTGKANTVVVDSGKTTVVIPYSAGNYWITVRGDMMKLRGETDLFDAVKAYYIPISGIGGALVLLLLTIRWYRKQEEKGVNEFIVLN